MTLATPAFTTCMCGRGLCVGDGTLTRLPARRSIVTQKEPHLGPVLSPSLEHIQHPLPVTYGSLCGTEHAKHISAQVRDENAHPLAQHGKCLLIFNWASLKACDTTNPVECVCGCVRFALNNPFQAVARHRPTPILPPPSAASNDLEGRTTVLCCRLFCLVLSQRTFHPFLGTISLTSLRPFHYTNGPTHYSRVEVNETDDDYNG